MKLSVLLLVNLVAPERRGYKLLGLRGHKDGATSTDGTVAFKRRGGTHKKSNIEKSVDGVSRARTLMVNDVPIKSIREVEAPENNESEDSESNNQSEDSNEIDTTLALMEQVPVIPTYSHFGMFETKPVFTQMFARGAKMDDLFDQMVNDFVPMTEEEMTDEEVEDEKQNPEIKIQKVTRSMTEWAEKFVPKYIKKDRLYVFATKLRQQFIGNLRSCTGHPDGGMGIKQRSNLLNDDNRILERLVPAEISSITRSKYRSDQENPLQMLDRINFILTRVIKQHLVTCKRFKHFARLRDTGMKQYIRAYIRYTRNHASNEVLAETLADAEAFEESNFNQVDEDGLIDDDFSVSSFDEYGITSY